MLQPVIIAGGSGTRLWPMSRQLYPKQFLPLTGAKSMVVMTIERLSGIDYRPPVVICNEAHRFIVAEQLRDAGIKHGGIILEPEGRNTAPAIGLSALLARELDSSVPMLILPADHYMSAPDEFLKGIQRANSNALDGKLVTFGIQPGYAATGYGYIKADKSKEHTQVFPVSEFVEKPNLATAEKYLSSGHYLWNSGIFMFLPDVYLNEIATNRPDIHDAVLSSWSNRSIDMDFVRPDAKAFSACPSESIDYAVMEKTRLAMVTPIDPGWSDLGSWSALLDLMPKSKDGNVKTGDVITRNSTGNYILAEHKLVCALGVNDLVIVDTKDALLIADRNQVEDVKSVVDELKLSQRSEYIHHREVYRPWGKYDSVDNGDRYQVKRITVKPGAKLSVQMHHHRSEHWVVVCGTARVRINDSEKLLSENESVYIPIGAVHSLENPGKIELELIEIQSGAYLGEDDIVRLEDKYGRS